MPEVAPRGNGLRHPYRLRLPMPSRPLPRFLIGLSYLTALHDWGMRPHRHTGLEIICCFSGQIALEIAGTWHIVPAGTVFAFDARDEHKVHVLTPPYCRWLLHIDCDALDRPESRRLVSQVPLLSPVRVSRRQQADLQLTLRRLLADVDHAQAREDLACERLTAILSFLLALERIPGARPLCGRHSSEARRVIAHVVTEVHRSLCGVSVHRLAQDLGYSTTHLQRLFRQEMGMSISEYIAAQRLELAARLLLHGERACTVSEVAKMLGFSDVHYFSRYFRRHAGYAPQEYRLLLSAARGPRPHSGDPGINPRPPRNSARVEDTR